MEILLTFKIKKISRSYIYKIRNKIKFKVMDMVVVELYFLVKKE